MKNSMILFFSMLLLISCSSNNSSDEATQNKIQDTPTKEMVETIIEKKEEPFVKVDSAVVRLSSNTRRQTLTMFTELYFSTNVDSLIYVDLEISYTDKYDKIWFKERAKLKDRDCNFSGWCSNDFSISYHSNFHTYESKHKEFPVGKSSFDLVMMNSKDFDWYYNKSIYKGQKVNLNVDSKSGYDRILIPNPKVKVINFKALQ